MSRPLRIIAIALAGLVPAGAGAARAAEPSTPASASAIVAYRDSGEWDNDTSAAIAGARELIDRRLATARPRRPALVLDVDDTSLSSYDCRRRHDFAPTGGACGAATRLPAIPQTLALFRHARAHDVAVIFLTGRREHDRRATSRNLRAAGYTGPRRLILRPDRERPGTHDGFKARRRRALQREGFTILANVGDQRSDLRGGAALGAFKLPNPMYLIPTA